MQGGTFKLTKSCHKNVACKIQSHKSTSCDWSRSNSCVRWVLGRLLCQMFGGTESQHNSAGLSLFASIFQKWQNSSMPAANQRQNYVSVIINIKFDTRRGNSDDSRILVLSVTCLTTRNHIWRHAAQSYCDASITLTWNSPEKSQAESLVFMTTSCCRWPRAQSLWMVMQQCSLYVFATPLGRRCVWCDAQLSHTRHGSITSWGRWLSSQDRSFLGKPWLQVIYFSMDRGRVDTLIARNRNDRFSVKE